MVTVPENDDLIYMGTFPTRCRDSGSKSRQPRSRRETVVASEGLPKARKQSKQVSQSKSVSRRSPQTGGVRRTSKTSRRPQAKHHAFIPSQVVQEPVEVGQLRISGNTKQTSIVYTYFDQHGRSRYQTSRTAKRREVLHKDIEYNEQFLGSTRNQVYNKVLRILEAQCGPCLDDGEV